MLHNPRKILDNPDKNKVVYRCTIQQLYRARPETRHKRNLFGGGLECRLRDDLLEIRRSSRREADQLYVNFPHKKGGAP
jgi:hypothetical protein